MSKFFEYVVLVLSLVAFALFTLVFVLDWTGGCGEAFEYANGTLHQGECIGRDLFFSIFWRIFQ